MNLVGIDSKGESICWSVLSNSSVAAKNDSGDDGHERSRMATDAVYKRLVRKDAALIPLLDPPFDRSNLNRSYIKGYVPDVREDGG